MIIEYLNKINLKLFNFIVTKLILFIKVFYFSFILTFFIFLVGFFTNALLFKLATNMTIYYKFHIILRQQHFYMANNMNDNLVDHDLITKALDYEHTFKDVKRNQYLILFKMDIMHQYYH